MSLKASLNSNLPTEDRRTVQFPSVKLIDTSSFSIDVLACECRVPPEQPRSESSATRRGVAVLWRGGSNDEGSRGIVSSERETSASSATRGAAAASGTTTADVA